MKIHELKIDSKYYCDIVSGVKTFEIRKNDRNYKLKDLLFLNEYEDGKATGKWILKEICYMTDYAQQEGYVVLGIVNPRRFSN